MHPLDIIPDPQPTDRDLRNAAAREAIAARQQEEYDRVLLWAMGKFGTGWLPSGRHYLLDKQVEDEARRTGERPVAAATCYTVKNAEGSKRHFIVKDGSVTECSGYEEGFGAMLQELYPIMRIEVKGEKVAPYRYNLCWAPIETYQPRSAGQLAAARVTRERKKGEKWAAEHPLYAMIEQAEREDERGR